MSGSIQFELRRFDVGAPPQSTRDILMHDATMKRSAAAKYTTDAAMANSGKRLLSSVFLPAPALIYHFESRRPD
jgi:hypothetical protein